MITVSVIIPTYRPSEYLSACLKSLKDQSISTDMFEIHLILNGEKQPFYNQIDKYIENIEIKNIKVHYSRKIGVSAARNLGLSASQSKYVLFIDDDDMVSDNYISSLLSIVNYKEDRVIVSNMKAFKCNNNFISDYISNAFKKCKNKPFSIFAYRGFMSSACGKIIPRKIINSTVFNEKVTISEDAMFMFQISKEIKSIELSTDDCIYFRRVRNDSASRRNKKYYEHLKIFFQSCYQFTKIYCTSPFRYNFLFYLSRLLASLKVLILKILIANKKRLKL